MCGIAGEVSSSGKFNLDIEGAVNSINHRGPDENVVLEKNFFKFGFSRLAIIDIEDGKQPYSNEDSSVFAIFNGEIYNHIELRESLVQKGFRFRSKADGEVIIALYELYGEKFPNHIQGR
jgi:asparagine synthase (glutamine-hydrolysing)